MSQPVGRTPCQHNNRRGLRKRMAPSRRASFRQCLSERLGISGLRESFVMNLLQGRIKIEEYGRDIPVPKDLVVCSSSIGRTSRTQHVLQDRSESVPGLSER